MENTTGPVGSKVSRSLFQVMRMILKAHREALSVKLPRNIPAPLQPRSVGKPATGFHPCPRSVALHGRHVSVGQPENAASRPPRGTKGAPRGQGSVPAASHRARARLGCPNGERGARLPLPPARIKAPSEGLGSSCLVM